jgi:WD40-like Beta Propeller Repeat
MSNSQEMSEADALNDVARHFRQFCKEFPGEASVFLLDCAISPDGNRIAYRAQGSGGFDIWISPLSGEAPVRLWDDPARAFQRGPSWSPDDNWMSPDDRR